MNPPDPTAPDLLDPETDPSASYALDQRLVRRLTGLLHATSGESKRAVVPGQRPAAR